MQRTLAVDLYIYDQGVGDWTTHYRLSFNQAIDWYNVVRLMTEGKYKHILRGLHLQYTLDAVLARGFFAEEGGFSADGGSESSFESARTA